MQHGIRGIYLCHIRVYRIDDQRSTINEKTRLMHPNCRRGSLPKMRGSRLSGSALLYLYSNICAPHRQDCCALFAYETALCDRKDTQSRFAVNAARSIVCVETLCPAALVPRGLRRHFGKTRFFAPFLASADELCPEKWGSHRRCPLCGAGCTVLERRNGGMRLCARAGALSISFSSYLMIARASFFFNDVFASMQRGR